VLVSPIPGFFLTCLLSSTYISMFLSVDLYLAAVSKAMASSTFLNARSLGHIQPRACRDTFCPDVAVGTCVVQVLSIQRPNKRPLQSGDLFTGSKFSTREEAIADTLTLGVYGFGNVKWWRSHADCGRHYLYKTDSNPPCKAIVESNCRSRKALDVFFGLRKIVMSHNCREKTWVGPATKSPQARP
jgi:hypothetical protein